MGEADRSEGSIGGKATGWVDRPEAVGADGGGNGGGVGGENGGRIFADQEGERGGLRDGAESAIQAMTEKERTNDGGAEGVAS